MERRLQHVFGQRHGRKIHGVAGELRRFQPINTSGIAVTEEERLILEIQALMAQLHDLLDRYESLLRAEQRIRDGQSSTKADG